MNSVLAWSTFMSPLFPGIFSPIATAIPIAISTPTSTVISTLSSWASLPALSPTIVAPIQTLAATKTDVSFGLFHWQGTLPMALTLAWVALPFFVGFSIYLLPRFDRHFFLGTTLLSLIYSLALSLSDQSQTLELVDHFGVTLQLDSLSGYFILTNTLVNLGVLLYCWHQEKTAFFYTQALILQGSVNAAFVCADFISLYVSLEVISIAAFLLIAYPRSDRSIWVGLRYLFVSNTAMLFYLLGAVLVYQASQSFAFTGLAQAPKEAIAFIFLGLLSKGGVFVSGLWLPLTHGEAETPVSAILSGSVVKTGIFPLLRLALLQPDLDPIVRIFGVATALLGVTCAILSKDTKRMLAFHTVSQLGFVLAAPVVGGFYALTHGLVKSSLFLTAGNLPSRSFKTLKETPLPPFLWGALALASFSIAGLPLFAGFGAKALTVNYLLPWQEVAMNLAAVGTAISFAKFIFLPTTFPWQASGAAAGDSAGAVVSVAVRRNLLPALAVLIGGLILGNAVYLEAYSADKILKAIVTIGLGWFLYHTVIHRLNLKLPQAPEQFENLIGTMSLMLTLIFWMVVA